MSLSPATVVSFRELVGNDYQVVLADPPWEYYGDPNKPQAAGKHYQTMPFEDMAQLPMKEIMAKKAVAFVWTTSSKMQTTCELIKRWGLHYRGIFQVWVKTTKTGSIINGQGVRPSFIKPTCEYLLVAATNEKGRTFPLVIENMENVVLAARPGNIHSRKPDVFRDNVVRLFHPLKRVELFARQITVGWDAWGNEVKTTVALDDIVLVGEKIP